MTDLNSAAAPRWIARASRGGWHWNLMAAIGLAMTVGCNGDGGAGTKPDYTVSVAPSALTVVPGADNVTTVTIDRTDFTGEVALTMTGAPAGVSGTFNPATTTGTTSTLTVSAGPATTPGDYGMIVRANSDLGLRAKPLQLTVEQPPPSFELSLAPPSLSIPQGGGSGSGVIISRTAFTGPVTLTVHDAPTGVSWSLNPVAPTGNGSTLTVLVGPAAIPGVYDLTVEGTGTPGSSSATLTLEVTAGP